MLKVSLGDVTPVVKNVSAAKKVQKATSEVLSTPVANVAKKVLPAIVLLGGGAYAITGKEAVSDSAKVKAADPCSDYTCEIQL